MSIESHLRNSMGSRLVGIRRVLYVYKGAIRQENGPLELTFDDGTSIVLDAGPDGESLVMCDEVWVDPFQEPLSDENLRWVASSGKWTAFEMTARYPHSRAIGNQLDGLDELRSPAEKVIGVRLQFGSVVLQATVDSDELVVDVG